MIKENPTLLFFRDYVGKQGHISGAFSRLDGLPELDFGCLDAKIHLNNTPPASLLAFGPECSAPRGVTRFWGAEK